MFHYIFFLFQTTLDVISESCVAALNHKTPTVKSETALFMARCFCKSTPATLPKKLLKMFAAPLIKVSWFKFSEKWET